MALIENVQTRRMIAEAKDKIESINRSLKSLEIKKLVLLEIGEEFIGVMLRNTETKKEYGITYISHIRQAGEIGEHIDRTLTATHRILINEEIERQGVNYGKLQYD